MADRVVADPRQAPGRPARAEVELDQVASWGDVRGASARQIVDDVHPPALCGQGMREMAADESGAAGYQRAPHGVTDQWLPRQSATRTGSRYSCSARSRACRTPPSVRQG